MVTLWVDRVDWVDWVDDAETAYNKTIMTKISKWLKTVVGVLATVVSATSFALEYADAMHLLKGICQAEQTLGSQNSRVENTLFSNVEAIKSDILFRSQIVGDRYIYPLPNDSSIRVDVLKNNNVPGRVSLEFSKQKLPVLFIMLDNTCQSRAVREITYQQGNAVQLKFLDDQFNTINSEDLNPAIPGKEGEKRAGIKVAMVDSGVNYQLPEIFNSLARDETGRSIGYDFWDMDDRPFDSHPVGSPFFIQHHGTQTASLLLSEAPEIQLVPYRYPRPDMSRMADLVTHAVDNDIRIIGIPLGGNKKQDWQVFEQAASENPQILFIASAGNNGVDIDQTPIYPASLDLKNLIVVTSANEFLRPAERTNWGVEHVDFMLPAERQNILRFSGESAKASGSSYAVSRMTAMAARVLDKSPELSTQQLITRLKTYALPASKSGFVKYGYIPDPTVQTEFPEFEQLELQMIKFSKKNDLYQLNVSVLLLDQQWNAEDIQSAIQ